MLEAVCLASRAARVTSELTSAHAPGMGGPGYCGVAQLRKSCGRPAAL